MPGLDTPLKAIVGGRTATALGKAFGMATVADLLAHYPRRYARRGELTDLSSLADGELVTIQAEVVRVRSRRMSSRRGSIQDVTVTDGTGTIDLSYFNQPWLEKQLPPGARGLFAGKISTYRGTRQLVHPEFELESAGDAATQRMLRPLVPVYPATAALPSWTIARAVELVLESIDIGADDDPVPPDVRRETGLPGFAQAVREIHQPDDDDQWRAARRRLAFDEAWVVQVMLAKRRFDYTRNAATPRPHLPGGLAERLRGALPFSLTAGQESAVAEITADLLRPHPMHRLLQGEVGSGKTMVALLAMLTVVDSGGQAALLAPTEVLAAQHLRSITAALGPLGRAGELGGDVDGTRVTVLTGSLPAAQKRRALLDAASGTAGIVIGTHALLSDPVQFADLGLVVVDEQHRFGVEQRAALALKAAGEAHPHVLVMTATPIPRTVALTVFGDLDTTTLRELPGGRPPITTHVVAQTEHPHYVARMWERIREEVAKGRQVYIVCPRIGPDEDEPDSPGAGSPDDPGHSVLALARDLADGPLAGLRVAVLHGRMRGEEKDEAMRSFAGAVGEPASVDVLVATTVIEVGVDVANASMMVVMDADRFGVSQLHQLRGRVGRGRHAALCLLHTGQAAPSPARDRLDAVAATTDGFELARIDLEQRREGDVLGVSQSGSRSSLRLLSVIRDEHDIELARAHAETYVRDDPDLTGCPALRREVDRWEEGAGEYVVKS